MTYAVKEIFYTLQGEGIQTGRAAVFCRFSGCNLWSGMEKDRDRAVCRFCDTDFVGVDGPGGGIYETADTLARMIERTVPELVGTAVRPFVVLTGGEPMMQVDRPLINALHERGFEVAIETNGTRKLPEGIDWVTVSPKAGSRLVVLRGNELKLVYPQKGLEPEQFETAAFDHLLLQPLDGPDRDEHIRLAVSYCLSHPRWRISLQTHKILGIP